jgi:hypothetical protein
MGCGREWKNNQQNGKGKMTMKDGREYSGMFKDGKHVENEL